MFDFFLYFAWFAIPLAFFIMSATLLFERLFIGKERTELSLYLRSGVFVSVCSAVTYVVDSTLINSFSESIPETYMMLARIVLYPLILSIFAFFIGGSEPIEITRDLDSWRTPEDD